MPLQPTSPTGTPLTAEQLNSLERAAGAYRELRRCAFWAACSGISTLAIGVLSLGCLSFGLATGLVAVVVLLSVGTIELIGRQKLLNADPKAPKLLAYNQLAFIAAITIYCGVQMATLSIKKTITEMNNSPELGGQVDINELFSKESQKQLQYAVYGFYGIVALLAWISQGRLALYYWRKKPAVEAFNATPEWQKQLVRNMSK